MENLEAQIAFTEQQSVEQDQQIKLLRDDNNTLMQKVQMTQNRLEEEQLKTQQMLGQLKDKGDKVNAVSSSHHLIA